MERIKTILVEDEGAALRRLQKFAVKHPLLEVVGTADSGKKALKIINDCSSDLILLDIELKDMTAFEVLTQLKNKLEAQIIFITAYNQYAVEAFDIAATDYLLKPYDENRFNKAIERAYHNKEKTNIQSLLNVLVNQNYTHNTFKFEIIEGSSVHYFLPENIIWIEADGYYSLIHKVDETSVLVRKTLKEIEQIVSSKEFVRINRSSIINTSYIVKETINIAQQFVYLKGNIKLKKSNKY
ncbi:LytTR family DNA-binding domain-containing protein [uncultured Psychroserpens sp.]|uniref:LytR/AlgR family response regulator transcription factor n=1 Tax=uncultured Psychroserpens sp. TaxID=255436 RepID=UPI00263069A7|nr:LytTR family DNA-binding domain-containing protein [uncultured Psychroserpens sp.]